MGRPRLTTEQFIERSKKQYGDLYDYSKVEYVRKDAKVIVICKVHGEFLTKPENHWNGTAKCIKCTHDKWRITMPMTREQFIEKAVRLYGNVYDYSKVEYKNNRTDVVIICKRHGEFIKTPNEHLSGAGCIKCSGRERLTTEIFIERAMKIHRGRYSYVNVSYKQFDEKVSITCKKHGDFLCTPRNHLQLKNGCPRCNSSKSEIFIRHWLTDNNLLFEEQKSFPTCRYKKKLRFDFYIPALNTLLEFDGMQHFDKSDENYEYNKLKDGIKNKWCADNGIKLIRIHYLEKLEQSLIKHFL